MKREIKKVGIALLIFIAIFVLANYQYFWQNISFILNKPDSSEMPQVSVEKGESNKLLIASIGVNVPVVYVDERSENIFQAALKNGVVHYPGTALPGQSGNVYIFGHSSDYVWVKSNYKSAFALLPKVAIGDEIVITDQAGKIFHYVVIEKQVVSPNDLSVLKQDESKHLLTLQTSYPIGTALKRYLVIAELK